MTRPEKRAIDYYRNEIDKTKDCLLKFWMYDLDPNERCIEGVQKEGNS